MRILIFSTAYFPFVGGAEVAIKEITDRLGDFEFELVTAKLDRKLPSTEKIGNVLVHRVGFGSKFDKLLLPFLGCVKVAGIRADRKVDVFWSMMVTWASWAAIFNNFFSRRKVPLVLTLQEGDSEKHLRRRWLGMIGLSWRIALRASSAVTAISSYLAYRAREYGWRKEVHLVPNGVELKKFKIQSSKLKKEELRKGVSIEGSDKVILTASRLVEKNAVDVVIRSLSHLPGNYKLLVFGDGELRQKLQNLAKELGVNERIVWWGKYEHEELAEYLSVTDVFTRPSRSEGQGIVFLEAMAAGVPVVTTPVGGIVDFIFDPEKNSEKPPTGLFTELENAADLARQIKKAAEDERLKKEVVFNARNLVEKKYTWDSIAKDMKSFFVPLEI